MMVEQKANDTEPTEGGGTEAEKTPSAPPKRVYSEVEFPYIDLEQALQLVQAIHDHAGGSCQDKELAAWLNQSPEGGTYKARRSAARMFGLVEIQAGILTLTALGRDATDAAKGRAARAEAFLKPELYSILYEAFGGHALPPPPAIERRIEQAGVSPKQRERARQAFQKSAIFAGYVDQTTGRFVRPGNGGMRPQDKAPDEAPSDKKNGGGGGDGPKMPQHPLVVGLFQSLPPDGEVWTLEDAAAWMEAAAVNLRIAYKFKGSIGVTATPPQRPAS